MTRLWMGLFLLSLCSHTAHAQQPTSPGPFATGNANFWSSATNPNAPGDEHGAVGRTYIVLKANLQFSFINRANIKNGYNPLPSGMPIPDHANLGNSNVMTITDSQVCAISMLVTISRWSTNMADP